MPRTWFYQKLMANPTLVTGLPGGVHQTTALMKAPDQRPFAVYRIVANRPELRGDDDDKVLYDTYLVFLHDNPGSYDKIDNLLFEIRQMFRNFTSDSQVMSATWLEDSEDFRDEDMGTILRYFRIRFCYRAALIP